MNLPNWKKWCDFRRNKPEITEANKLNRVNARYRLVTSFRGLKLEGVSERTTKGYDVAVRLMLCYSVAESLAHVISGTIHNWQMCDDANLATRLRKLFMRSHAVNEDGTGDTSLISLTNHLDNGMMGRLTEFLDGKTDNVRIVATALRHLMAHGHLTVSGLGITSVRDQKLIDELSQKLLEKCGSEFENWMNTKHSIK